MKKLILCVLLILLVPATVWATSPYILGVSGTPVVAPSAYDGDENFETATTGYEESWSEYNKSTNTVNPVYATSALRGSQSLRLTGIASGTPRGVRSGTFTATDSFYCAFRWRLDTEPTGSGQMMQVLDAAAAEMGNLYYDTSTDRISIFHGARSVASTYTLSASTIYYIWYEYEKNTGGGNYNGVSRLYISTTRTKPETAAINDSLGRSEGDITSFTLVNIREGVTIFDQVLWDFTDPLGDMPE